MRSAALGHARDEGHDPARLMVDDHQLVSHDQVLIAVVTVEVVGEFGRQVVELDVTRNRASDHQ